MARAVRGDPFETGENPRRYYVGIASVSRRCENSRSETHSGAAYGLMVPPSQKGLGLVQDTKEACFMIDLYQYRPVLGLPNASPFCMKAEAYFLYRDLPYKAVASSPRKSPSGQVPFIVTDGKTIPDTEAIMDHFEAQSEAPLDAHLTERQKAKAAMVRQLVEQELFHQVVYMRWVDPKGWAAFAPILKPHMPRMMQLFAMPILRRVMMRRLKAQGLRADAPAAAYTRGVRLLETLSDFIGPEGFAFGDQVTRLDMSLYAFLANILEQTIPSPLKSKGQEMENLVAYCARMKAVTFAKVQGG